MKNNHQIWLKCSNPRHFVMLSRLRMKLPADTDMKQWALCLKIVVARLSRSEKYKSARRIKYKILAFSHLSLCVLKSKSLPCHSCSFFIGKSFSLFALSWYDLMRWAILYELSNWVERSSYWAELVVPSKVKPLSRVRVSSWLAPSGVESNRLNRLSVFIWGALWRDVIHLPH